LIAYQENIVAENELEFARRRNLGGQTEENAAHCEKVLEFNHFVLGRLIELVDKGSKAHSEAQSLLGSVLASIQSILN
jgi:hypothetical protein